MNEKVRLHPVKAEIDHLHIDAAKEEAFVNYYNLTYRFWDFLQPSLLGFLT